MAASLTGLLLDPSPAHAGSYTDARTGGTTAATVTPAADATYSTPQDAIAKASMSPMGNIGGPTYTIGINPGTLTDTFTWTPASGQTTATDPPPSCVLVGQNSSATWYVRSENGTGTGSGQADCGLPGGTVTSGTYGNGPSQSRNAILYSVKSSPGASFSVSCSPTASFTGQTGSSGSVEGEAEVSGGASVYPVTLSLRGTTPDSSQNPNILIGQQCTATVVVGTNQSGASFAGTLSNFRWSVSGTTFESWSPTTPAFPNASPPTQANSQASYYSGVIPATSSTQWYWNDLIAAKETVSCTVTVTPPAGQGNSFSLTVTAPKQVNVQVPAWKATGTGGYMQVNANCDGINPTISLYAGPTKGTSYVGGMNFALTVYTPQTPAFGNGQIELVQIITPNYTYVTNTSPPQNHAFPQNNMKGLDAAYPYKSFSTPETNEDDPTDSPNIPLPSTTASATLQGTFTDYLMYEPPNSSQFVPLATFTWSANGTASSSTGDWAHYKGPTGTDAVGGTVSDPNTATPFTADKGGTDFPSWTQIIKSVLF